MSYFSKISQRSGSIAASGLLRPLTERKLDVADVNDPFQEIAKETGDAPEGLPAANVVSVRPPDRVVERSASDQNRETTVDSLPRVDNSKRTVIQSIQLVEQLGERVERAEKLAEVHPPQQHFTGPVEQSHEVKDKTKATATPQLEPPILVRNKGQKDLSIGPPPVEPSDFRSLDESKGKMEKKAKQEVDPKPLVLDSSPSIVTNNPPPIPQQPLLPKAPVAQAKTIPKASPKLVIGKITVELRAPPPVVQQHQKPAPPAKRTNQRSNGRTSKLKYNSRFGLGQI